MKHSFGWIGAKKIDCRDRTHFFALAAGLMRRVLVDHARSSNSIKRGGKLAKLSIDSVQLFSGEVDAEIIALDDALDRLSELDQASHVVELRFFSGMSNEEEVAEALGISARTVKRDWQLARAWLFG